MFNCTILELQVSASADSSRRGGGSKHSHPHFCEYCLSRSSDLYPLECERLLSSIMPSGNAKATQIALLRSCIVCCNDTVVALEKRPTSVPHHNVAQKASYGAIGSYESEDSVAA